MTGDLAKKLRVLRAERGLTLQEAAERVHVRAATLSDLERGRSSRPHASTIAKLARGYGVSVAELVDDAVIEEQPARPLVDDLLRRGAFEELRRRAREDGTEGARIFSALTNAYDAAVVAHDHLVEAGVSVDLVEEAAEHRRTLKMLWRVAVSERIAQNLAHTTMRSSDAPTYPDTTDLPLEEAYEVVSHGAVLEFAD